MTISDKHMTNPPQLLRRQALAGLAATIVMTPYLANAATEQQELLKRATLTLNATQNDAQFGTVRNVMQRAVAVMVVPQLIKGGFIVGGEGGDAVLLTRSASGKFENPRFYFLASVSLGLQIGLEVSEVVLCVMSQRALQAWAKDEVKLGAKAGLTVLVVGTSAEAAATTNANVDVIAWARSKGAYGGITLEGSVIKARDEWNREYYGRPVPRLVGVR